MWTIIKTAKKNAKKGHYIYCQTSPPHPNSISGWVPMHCVIMENHHNRRLQHWEVVHHKNRIKHDNRVENLEVMSRIDHSILHGKEDRLTTVVEVCCPECQMIFLRDKRQTFLTKKAHKWSFCSRKCSGKFSRAIRYNGMTPDKEQRVQNNIVRQLVM